MESTKKQVTTLFNLVKILSKSKRPISNTDLHNTLTCNGTEYTYYLTILTENNLIGFSNERTKDMNKEVRKVILITDKGREFLELWVGLNKLIGVSVCQYI